MYLLNYDFYDLHSLFVFFRNSPERFADYRPALQQLADYIQSPSRSNALQTNTIRTILKPCYHESDTLISWVLVNNAYSANFDIIKQEAAYAVLSAIICEMEAHYEDAERFYALCDAIHNIPLLLADSPEPVKAIIDMITPYRLRYNSSFLVHELSLFPRTKAVSKKRGGILKKLPKTVDAWIFYLSLLYYVFWILYAVISMFIGIDSGWAMPAMSSHNKDYGILAFASTIGMGMLYTATIFWFIPLYQILYLIASGIRKAIKKRSQADNNAN